SAADSQRINWGPAAGHAPARRSRVRARPAQAGSAALLRTHRHPRMLSSKGTAFGDAGFYRIRVTGPDRLVVWRVSTLHEDFHVYVDDANVLRCDHTVRFFGMKILHLHYRVERAR